MGGCSPRSNGSEGAGWNHGKEKVDKKIMGLYEKQTITPEDGLRLRLRESDSGFMSPGHFRFELFLALSAPSGNGITHGDDLSL